MDEKKTNEQETTVEAEPEKTAAPGEETTGDASPEAQLAKELERLQTELKEAKDTYLRMLAEYDNFRRRTAREKESVWSDAVAETVKGLLPIADNLERATAASGDAEALIFQIEKSLADAGDKFTDADKAPVNDAINHLKETLKGNDVDAIKADSEALEKAFYPLAEKLYAASGAQGAGDAGAAGNGAGAGAPGGDGTIYGTDFEDKTGENK